MARRLDRRDFLRLTALGGVGLGLSGCARKRRPNVLFIAVDDLNDWAGCLGGHPDARTPNLDRLAAGGVLFTQAHCCSPLCSASRTAVFTGLEPTTTGVYRNQHDFRRRYPDLETLPETFRAAGYRTLGVGKLFHFPHPEAFEEHVAHGQKDLRPFRTDPSWGFEPPLRKRDLLNWGPVDVEVSEMFDGKVVGTARDFLAAEQDRPFLLAVGLFQPHLPWYVPARYFEPFPPDRVVMPPVLHRDIRDVPRPVRWTVESINRRLRQRLDGEEQRRKSVAAYLAAMAFMDDMLGRILEALARGPSAADTLIVLWSDHGHLVGEKNHWGKHVLWDDATHVPLVFSAPWIEGGRTCPTPLTLIHLYPTLLDLCGLEPRPGLDGQSLAPLLADPSAAWQPPAIMTYQSAHSVRTERWRYTRHGPGPEMEELYDHLHDPHEWHNRSDSGPLYDEVKQRLAARLPTEWARAIEDVPGPLPEDQ